MGDRYHPDDVLSADDRNAESSPWDVLREMRLIPNIGDVDRPTFEYGGPGNGRGADRDPLAGRYARSQVRPTADGHRFELSHDHPVQRSAVREQQALCGIEDRLIDRQQLTAGSVDDFEDPGGRGLLLQRGRELTLQLFDRRRHEGSGELPVQLLKGARRT